MAVLTQKAAAELRRNKTALEQQRLEIKKKCEQHRSTMTTEQLSAETENMRSLSEQIDTINEQLKDAPEPDSRGGIFMPTNGSVTADNFRESIQYRDAFFRSFINGRVADTDAEVLSFGKRAITDMNGGSVTAGAEYLVPQTTLNEIQSVIVKYGPVYAAVTKYRFNGDVTIPIGTADTPTNNANGTDTLKFTFTEVVINQQAIVAVIKVKNLLLKNSIAGLEKYLSTEIGKYIGIQQENYVLNGTLASSKFLGIIPAVTEAPSAAKTYSAVDWPTIAGILGVLESPYGDDGTFIMKRATFFNKFFAAVDDNGRPLVSTLPAIGAPGSVNYYIGGRPVIFSSRILTANAFIYGDLSQYIVNESQEIVIEASAVSGFDADETTWRGKVYAGGRPMFPKQTFTYYTYSGT